MIKLQRLSIRIFCALILMLALQASTTSKQVQAQCAPGENTFYIQFTTTPMCAKNSNMQFAVLFANCTNGPIDQSDATVRIPGSSQLLNSGSLPNRGDTSTQYATFTMPGGGWPDGVYEATLTGNVLTSGDIVIGGPAYCTITTPTPTPTPTPGTCNMGNNGQCGIAAGCPTNQKCACPNGPSSCACRALQSGEQCPGGSPTPTPPPGCTPPGGTCDPNNVTCCPGQDPNTGQQVPGSCVDLGTAGNPLFVCADFSGGTPNTGGVGLPTRPGIPVLNYSGPLINLANFLKVAYKIMVPVGLGIYAIPLILINGYTILTSQGDPQKVKSGKEGFSSAILGALFVLLALNLLRIAIGALLGGTI